MRAPRQGAALLALLLLLAAAAAAALPPTAPPAAPALALASLDEARSNVSNLALGKAVFLSSSSHAPAKRFQVGASRAVDGDVQTDVETLSEAAGGYLLIDLAAISYVDEIVIFTKAQDQDLTVSLADRRNASTRAWSTTVYSANPSPSRIALHVHAAGRWVKVQRVGPGKLWVHEVQVMGSPLTPSDLPFRSCLTGHDGQERCSNHGVCMETGICSCSLLWEGSRCEDVRHDVLASITAISALALYLVLFPAQRWCWRFLQRQAHRYAAVATQDRHRDEDLACVSSSSSSSTSLNASPSVLGVCVFFASPLVVFTENGGVAPVPQLNLSREISLLKLSFEQAGAIAEIPIDVTCGTADALVAAVSLSFCDVLHVSSHCEADFIVLESEAGLAHIISIRQLAGLLKAGLTGQTSLKLVVLNSCHSGNAAQAFIDAGVKHVIALDVAEKVSDACSTVFTRSLYLGLASGRTIADAFDIATHAVSLCGHRGPQEAAAFRLLPLDNAAHNTVLWPAKPAKTPAPPRRLLSSSSAAMVPSSRLPLPACEELVGRQLDMWNVLTGLLVRKRRLCCLHGTGGVGKSEFALAVLHYYEQRFRNDNFAQLVDLSHDTNQSREALLGRISHELGACKSGGLVVLDHVPAEVLASRDLYNLLSSMLRAQPLLNIVVTADSASQFGDLAILGFAYHLAPLSDADSRRLLERLCGGPLIVDHVEEAQGNPRVMKRVASKLAFASDRGGVRMLDVERLL